ncbi:MAG: hypothetical protein EBS29_01140 [Chloroflexia bacterium]|nr:hypothetical protein [Chloroflexia bacterium]
MSDVSPPSDASPPSDTTTLPRIGFVVSVEQLALLRDLLSTAPISVVIADSSDTTLLDDQWKPWARRVRTQLKQVCGPIIVRAPSYLFPDPHLQPKIRDTIANQLQALCDLAVVLAAHKIIVPIEAGIPALYPRICHYLTPLASRINDQQMTLVLETGIGTTATAIVAIQQLLALPTEVCLSDGCDDADTAMTTHYYRFEKNNWADNREVATDTSPTCTLLIGPTENTQLFRQYWDAWPHQSTQN